jgi:hypothetical protein
VQAGAAGSLGTGDADSLYRGSGSKWQGFSLSPVFMYSVCEISHLAAKATEGKARGLFNVSAQEMKNSLQQMLQFIESQINSDGTGQIDQIPTTATINKTYGTDPLTGDTVGCISGLNVAACFTDQQTVQVVSIGGTNRGSFVVTFVDPVNNSIYWDQTATPLPTASGGTQVTDYLVVNGPADLGPGGNVAPGTAGYGLLGIRYWHVNSNTGVLAGVNRASFPGRLSTPVIELNGGALTPNVANRAEILLGRALGPENDAMDSAIWYGPPEQQLAHANMYYNARITQNLEKGESTPDMARKKLPSEFGGRKYFQSFTAQPNRIDLLLMKNWYIGELIEVQLYDFGSGMTVVPVPDIGTSGGTYKTSHMFAYECCFNIANSAPKGGLYVHGCAVPTV